MIDYTKLIEKISPVADGEDVLRLRVGVVAAIASDGTVDVTINGVTVPDVPVLGGAYFAVASTVQILSYRGSLLILGAAGPGAGKPVQLLAANNTYGGTPASTTFVNTLTTIGTHGVAFIAPPSGSVFVTGHANGRNSNAGSGSLLDLDVRTGAVVGSGSTIYTPADATSQFHTSGTANAQGSLKAETLISGLTPGTAYNASLAYASSGANVAEFARRYIAVLPQ